MSEEDFHPSAVLSALENLQEHFVQCVPFSPKCGFAIEFAWQQLLVIRGGLLYQEYLDFGDTYQHSFCRFMDEDARLVH